MLYHGSRYSIAAVTRTWDEMRQQSGLTVLRSFPLSQRAFEWRSWIVNDRLDLLADEYLGDAAKWWVIADMNPEVANWMAVPPGTPVRVPSRAQ